MTTARELLRSTLPYVGDAAQKAKIMAWLGEPVHVGDTITLRASYPDEQEEPTGELGYTFEEGTCHYIWRGEEETTKVRHTLYPEAMPCTGYQMADLTQGIVVGIKGRRYRLTVSLHCGEYGEPRDATVVLERTSDPCTVGHEWDHDEALGVDIGMRVKGLAVLRSDLKDPALDEDDRDWLRSAIQSQERKLRSLRAGGERLSPDYPVVVGGQPQFLQNAITPTYHGTAASHLVTINTGWGDGGNAVILFACDDEGVPCKAWLEASCR